MSVERRALLGLVLVALLARLALWGWFDDIAPRIYDERDYDRIATTLATSGEFAVRGERTSLRPPLYPALVALVYRLAGVADYQAVRLLQIFLDAALVVVVFALGRRLYDERTGLLAAGLAAFYPSLWGHDYLLLTEVSFTLLLCSGTLALVEHSSAPRQGRPPRGSPASTPGPRWWLLVAGGVLLGLAALTRSSLFLYPPFMALAVFALSSEPRARRIAAVAVFVAAFAVTVGPWIARNSRLHGQLSPIDSNSGRTVVRFSPVAPGALDGRGDPAERRPAARPEAQGSEERAAAPERASGERSRAPQSLPVRFARSIVRNALAFWRVDREIVGAAARGWLGPIPRQVWLGMAAIIGLYYVSLLLAGVFGALLRPPANRLQLGIVVSVIAVLAGAHALSIGHSRYHVPVMPLVALFAARLLVTWREPMARRRLAAATAIAAVLIGSWVIGFLGPDRADLEMRLGGDSGPRRGDGAELPLQDGG